MEYAFSASKNAFYAKSLFKDYTLANSWPDDAKDVDEEVYLEYAGEPPTGKRRVVDGNGKPVWEDVPIDYEAKAEAHRQSLLMIANSVTADWRIELQLGIISDDDKGQLTHWMSYIQALKRLDLSRITGENMFNQIEWPTSPYER
ncbi:TPA: tail fiber assembly protein [Escherichia coli]|nr:MAG TPA: tail fiber assembly protein [Caudoviricetes sp.]HBP8874066.1 tail fiber assembly protein [Escherichia coli]